MIPRDQIRLFYLGLTRNNVKMYHALIDVICNDLTDEDAAKKHSVARSTIGWYRRLASSVGDKYLELRLAEETEDTI